MNSVPKAMRAFVLTGHGGFDKLEWHEDWPTPEPGDEEVLIKVHACGLNNTDVNTRSGWYSKSVVEATTGEAQSDSAAEDPSWGGAPLAFPRIQGADAVGTVLAVGRNAAPGLVGKRVMVDPWQRNWNDLNDQSGLGYFGSECDGGFADYTTANVRNVLPVNSKLSSAELATFACSYTTAENMLNRAQVADGDRVLVAGASGGVGSALLQLANRRGATTIAMASKAKHGDVARLTPDAILDRNPEDLAAALDQATGHKSVTVVADIVGGPAFGSLIDVLGRGGRYVCSGAIAGPVVDLDLRRLYLRDLTFYGSTVTTTDVFPALVQYVERSEIKPMLASTFPLDQLKVAQQAFIDKNHVGNIVVTMD